MKEYIHKIAKTGEEFTHKLPESFKELSELVGKTSAFQMAETGYRIVCNAEDRNLGKESKTAKLKKALAALKANPALAKQIQEEEGIDISEL